MTDVERTETEPNIPEIHVHLADGEAEVDEGQEESEQGTLASGSRRIIWTGDDGVAVSIEK